MKEIYQRYFAGVRGFELILTSGIAFLAALQAGNSPRVAGVAAVMAGLTYLRVPKDADPGPITATVNSEGQA